MSGVEGCAYAAAGYNQSSTPSSYQHTTPSVRVSAPIHAMDSRRTWSAQHPHVCSTNTPRSSLDIGHRRPQLRKVPVSVQLSRHEEQASAFPTGTGQRFRRPGARFLDRAVIIDVVWTCAFPCCVRFAVQMRTPVAARELPVWYRAERVRIPSKIGDGGGSRMWRSAR